MIFSSFPPFFSPFLCVIAFYHFQFALLFRASCLSVVVFGRQSRYNCPRPFTSDIFSHFGRCWESIPLVKNDMNVLLWATMKRPFKQQRPKNWWRRKNTKIIKQRNRKQWRWEDRIEPISVQQFHSYRIGLLLVQESDHLSQLLCPLSGHFN